MCGCIRKAHKGAFLVVEYSVLSNHLHFVVEAQGKEALTRGMQGLTIRLAKALNKAWGRRGTVFPERYFARFVRKVGEIRRLLRYVLQNARKHGVPLGDGLPDPFSSAPWFPWRECLAGAPREPAVTRRGQGMELYVAMQGSFSLFDLPGSRALATSARV